MKSQLYAAIYARTTKTMTWLGGSFRVHWRKISWLLAGLLVWSIMPATPLAASSGAQGVRSGSANYLPVMRNNVCAGTRSAENPFGVQVYGTTGYRQDYFTLLQNSQSAWVRNSIVWASVEPTNRDPDKFQWHAADAAVQAAVDNCVNLIITLDHTPEWATISYDRAPIQPLLLHEYVEFVTAVVERYDGDGTDDAPSGAVVNYWEFYNEPDLGTAIPGNEGWGEHGDLYAEMLKAVYEPVHKANPNAQVVFGGIAYNLFTEHNGLFVREFFQDVLDAGGGDYFDIMNFHYYPFQHNRSIWTTHNSSGLLEKADDIRDKLAAEGLEKPLMLTEIGWHSDVNTTYPSSPEYQGRQVMQLLTQAKASGFVAMIWWLLVEGCCGYPYRTGLATDGLTIVKKPAYLIFQEAVTRLGTSEFVGTVQAASDESDLEVHEFYNPANDQHFYVAWLNPVAPYSAAAAKSFDDTVTQEMSVAGSLATLFAKDGLLVKSIADADDGEEDGEITVQVGRSPIYIVISTEAPTEGPTEEPTEGPTEEKTEEEVEEKTTKTIE
jgi:hypothetical protein